MSRDSNSNNPDSASRFTFGASRRNFLKGVAGVGALASLSSSSSSATTETVAAVDWSNASGQAGTKSEPFTDVWAKNAHHKTVDTDEVNNTRSAEPGNVQTVLNNAGSAASIGYGATYEKVLLEPRQTYDEGAELDVPPGVILDMNGAVLTASSDHNLVFLDNGAHLRNAQLEVPSSWSAGTDAVVLDTSRSTYGRYANGAVGAPASSHATVEGTIIGDPAQTSGSRVGNGVALRDSVDAGITNGVELNVNVGVMNNAILLATGSQSGGSFVNPEGRVQLFNSDTLVRHEGDAQGDAHFWGTMQCNGEYGIRNVTTNNRVSVRFRGKFWDPMNCSQFAIAGQQIWIDDWANTSWQGNGYTDGSLYQYVLTHSFRGWELYNGETDGVARFNVETNGVTVHFNGTEIARIGPGGDVVVQNGDVRLNGSGTGVTATSPDGNTTKTWGTKNDGTWGELP